MRTPMSEVPCNEGVQRLYRFLNNRGASVVRHPHSYGGRNGLWELAVIRFGSKSNDDWGLDYSTPITYDVLGYLTEAQVDELLDRIEALPEAR